MFQLQSVNNNKKDATLTEPDYSVERAKSTFFLFLPGVTPGIFLFLVFGTTAGCRAAIKNLLTASFGKKMRTGNKKLSDVERVDNVQRNTYLFAETETGAKKEETTSDPTKSLPISSLVSKYNRSFDRYQASTENHVPTSSRKSWLLQNKNSSPGETDTVELRGITSLDELRSGYYQSSPEESDDSGLVLPIMSHQQRIIAGTTSKTASPALDKNAIDHTS